MVLLVMFVAQGRANKIFLLRHVAQCVDLLHLSLVLLYASAIPVLTFSRKLDKITPKPGLHIVVRIAEHACDDASKRILKPSTYRLKIFLVRDQYLPSLPENGDQATAGQFEKHVRKPLLATISQRAYYSSPGVDCKSSCERLLLSKTFVTM